MSDPMNTMCQCGSPLRAHVSLNPPCGMFRRRLDGRSAPRESTVSKLKTENDALKQRVGDLEAERDNWVKWLVEEIGFPYDVQYQLNPPCSPMDVATAWKAHDNDPDLYPEDYLNTMEMELGKEYMDIWQFNSKAALKEPTG